MASKDMGLVSSQRLDNGLNAQLLFQDDNTALPFTCTDPQRHRDCNPGPKIRHLCGFTDKKPFHMERERFFSLPQGASDFRRDGIYGGVAERRTQPKWGEEGNGSDGDEEEEEEEDDEEEVDDAAAAEVRLVASDGGEKNNRNSGGRRAVIRDKKGDGDSKGHSIFVVDLGSSPKDMIIKDGCIGQPVSDMNIASIRENEQQRRVGQFPNPVTVAEPDGNMYYSQFLQASIGSAQGQDMHGDNACGSSGRKDGLVSCDPVESLREIFSDPITGALMDDAMILPCGHTFGSGGIHQVLRMKACYTCAQPVSENSVAPNLSLRAAVQAFLREEAQMCRLSKRRKERFEQDRGSSVVRFPFAVMDRVIIKGNKRTPERFVGREAIVTTQCLNGWYVVKTLDNAESVKLQYRSLAKALDNPSSKPLSDSMTPSWLYA